MTIVAGRVVRAPPFQSQVFDENLHEVTLGKALVLDLLGFFAYFSRSHVSTTDS